MSAEELSAMQRSLNLIGVVTRTRHQYRAQARWWELEAKRGYPSSGDSLRYAANMRHAATLTEFHGPGNWLELQERQAAAVERARRERGRWLSVVRANRRRAA